MDQIVHEILKQEIVVDTRTQLFRNRTPVCLSRPPSARITALSP